jgi:hypothetical protein
MLWTKDGTLWLIDHTRAFRIGRELLNPERLLRIDSTLLERLRTLRTDDVMALARDGTLTEGEAGAVLSRRDLIVRHYDERVRRFGEDVVIFTLAGTE